MTSSFAFVFLPMVAATLVSAAAQVKEDTHAKLAHTRAEFSFDLSAPYEEVFPLFGAYEERKWAKGFDPQFIHPVPPHDEPGMVFTTVQEGLQRLWMNTAFDPATGHVQYVYWIADTMVAQIDIHIENRGARETHVDVVYERTSLRIEANELIVRMAHADAHAGPHWAEMIHGYFQSVAAK